MALTQLYPVTKQSVGESGAAREQWIRIDGGIGNNGTLVLHGVENPYYEDLLITKVILNVLVASGNVATDLDVGLADDLAGTNVGAEVADGMVAATTNVTGYKDLGTVHAIATPPPFAVWKAKGSTTDSFLCFNQKGAVDASAMRFSAYVKVVPTRDLLC